MRNFLIVLSTAVVGVITGWKIHALVHGRLSEQREQIKAHTLDLARALAHESTRQVFVSDLMREGLTREEAEAAATAVASREVLATPAAGIEVLAPVVPIKS